MKLTFKTWWQSQSDNTPWASRGMFRKDKEGGGCLLVTDRLSYLPAKNIYVFSICNFQAQRTIWKVRPQSVEIVVRNVTLLW